MSTHGIESSNGTTSSDVDPLAGVITALEEQLMPLSAEREQLEARLRDLSGRETRIKEGIAALTGKPVRTVARQARDERNSHDWIPSVKTLDDVYACIVNAEEPVNVTFVANAVHTSRGTAKKAVDELRSQNRVRFVGKAGKGSANLYAPMPRD